MNDRFEMPRELNAGKGDEEEERKKRMVDGASRSSRELNSCGDGTRRTQRDS